MTEKIPPATKQVAEIILDEVKDWVDHHMQEPDIRAAVRHTLDRDFNAIVMAAMGVEYHGGNMRFTGKGMIEASIDNIAETEAKKLLKTFRKNFKLTEKERARFNKLFRACLVDRLFDNMRDFARERADSICNTFFRSSPDMNAIEEEVIKQFKLQRALAGENTNDD